MCVKKQVFDDIVFRFVLYILGLKLIIFIVIVALAERSVEIIVVFRYTWFEYENVKPSNDFFGFFV